MKERVLKLDRARAVEMLSTRKWNFYSVDRDRQIVKIDAGGEKAAVLGSRVAPEAAAQSTPTAFLADFQLLPVEQVSGSFEGLGRLGEYPELEALIKKVEEPL